MIRHGEVKNPKNIEYVRLPGFGLSAVGIKQCQDLRIKLAKENIVMIFSSPLERATQSAKIISNNKIPIEILDEITEANYTRWEGLNRNKRPKKELDGYKNDPVRYSEILGESLIKVQKRVVDKIEEIIKIYKGKTVAMVFHADPIITAMLHYQNKPISDLMKIELKHASVTSIIFDDELKCEEVKYMEYVKAKDWRK